MRLKPESSLVLNEGEQLIQVVHNVELFLDHDCCSEGKGYLVLTSKRIIWNSDLANWEFDFSSVILHALSRGSGEGNGFDSPCIFVQLDCPRFNNAGNLEEEEEVEEEGEEGVEYQDLRLVPDDLSHCKTLILF
jgi:hypothetical protein